MKRNSLKYLMGLFLLFSLSRCANIGRPDGGMKDEIPPVLKDSKPIVNSLGFDNDKVRIFFDEIVVLKNLSANFLVSPPMNKTPRVSAYGKELFIEFEDTLQSNTTYTLYFGDAVVDNNEGNMLRNFSFSFSTGYDLDTMRLQGIVVDAATLDPVSGIIVGIYDNYNDSVFTKNVPLRIAKTNANGVFSVNNVKPGAYIVRALLEMDNDFKFSKPTETIAFCDSIYTTHQETLTLLDSVFKDSVGMKREIIPVFVKMQPRDTIVYYPDDILLRSFQEKRFFQVLNTKERLLENIMNFEFEYPLTQEPHIALLDDTLREDWIYSEISDDSLMMTYWIKDTSLVNLDTINIRYDYQVFDSLAQLVWQRDTIAMRFKRKKKSARQQRREEKNAEKENIVEKAPPLKMSSNVSGNLPYFDDVFIQTENPILNYDKNSIHLWEVVNDSTLKSLNYKWEEEPHRTYRLSYKWDEESQYRLIIDSAIFHDIYGLVNDSIAYNFKIDGEDKFSTIIMNISNLKENAVVQLFDKSQEIISSRSIDKNGGEVFFDFLKPGTYYVNLFLDANNNGKWDTGNYGEHLQPEELRYFSKAIEAKAYYEMEEDWDVEAFPLLEQKPIDLRTKNSKKK